MSMSEERKDREVPGHPPEGTRKIKVLLVDDEQRFRRNLADRLGLRGFEVQEVDNGGDAIRRVRLTAPDVVIMDRKMPGMAGEEALKEIKRIAEVVQVVMLTGHANISSAAVSGRLDAFAYLEKPCETEVLVHTIEAAYQEKHRAMSRHEIPRVESASLGQWLKGTHNSRPGVMILGALLFAALFILPAPKGLIEVLGTPKTGGPGDPIAGYSKYGDMKAGESVAEYYSRNAKLMVEETGGEGETVKRPMTPAEAATKAKVMVGILVMAALFWATGALPIGITALLVGVLMYLFGVFPPDMVAAAYAKDAVLFIMGVLALSVGIAKTGLDRRIGLVLLGTSRSLTAFLFLFCPLLAVTASFLSEHALVAFIAPLLMMVYMSGIRAAGLKADRHLAVLFVLSICFVANQGGPGSPAAGGRNAVMIGILSEYGVAPSFGEWVRYGLPFVPVAALAIATYFFIAVRRKVSVRSLNVADIVRKESKKLGAMTREEYITLAVLLVIVVLWVAASDVIGMGGPVLLGLVALAVFRVIVWRDINKISWDVVALYGSACAMGAGLAHTGAALWIAGAFVDILPEALSKGEGLAMASSLFTGVLTNIMSDGATVSAIGPITVPMASISGTHPWMVGLATAFASSFANCFIVGTPNNAIAYTLAKDLDTGEQMVTLGDFFKHGLAVTLIAFAVLWGWAFFGYWRWIGFN
jgi:solute carrier family 13 (sodium-dependent dicarboxylate transporter), member 2/3/5